MSDPLGLLIPALLSASWKAALLIGAATLLTRRMRRSTAAARHLVWSSTLAGALLLPLLSSAVPALPVLPRMAGIAASPAAPPAAEVRGAGAPAAAEPAPAPSAPSALPLAAAPADAALRVDWGRWLPLLWMLGAAGVLLRLGAGVLGVWWLGRRAEMVTDGGWLHLAHELARRLGLSRGVTLLHGDRGSVPMTWGVLQPIIWLPAGAEEWSPERRTVVLAHELAHVRRRDALTQWIAHLALVVHWFNPLVWHAVRRLREERERACDDAVLEIGTLPATYADHLLDLVRSLGDRGGPSAAMAMARRSQFEGRLLAILDGAARRGGISRGAAAGTLAFVLGAVLPLASLRAGEPLPAAAAAGVTLSLHDTESGPPEIRPRGGDRPQAAAGERPGTASRATAGADTVPSTGSPGAHDPLSLVALVRELDSDGEKALLLSRALRLQPGNEALRRDVVRASRTIRSSGDRASVLLAVLREPAAEPRLLGEVLAATSGIASSGDQASVLLQVVKRLPLEDPAACEALFSVLGEVESSGDRAAVLLALLQRRDLRDATLSKALRAAGRLESDGDAASVLTRAAQVHHPRLRGALQDAYLEAIRGIASSSDRAAALSALLGPTAAEPDRGRTASWSGFTSEAVLQGSHDDQPSFDLTVRAKEVLLTPDREGVAGLLPGGHLFVDHTRYPGNPDPDPLLPAGSRETVRRSLRVRPDGDGFRFDYTVNGERREFAAEGRAWLAQVLRHIHRG